MDLWESSEQLAGDLNHKHERVRKWRQRGIPPLQWPAVMQAAATRGKVVTIEMLTGAQPVVQPAASHIDEAAA